MEDFSFQSKTKIVFGKGKENEVGSLVREYGTRALVHFGGDYLKKNGLLDRICTSLSDAGVEWTQLDGVVPNPRLSLVEEGIKICREKKVDFILAIGGGSAIDSSKAIALGVPYEGKVWDFYTGDAEPKQSLPVGSVLTIPGSGSEMSESSIITNEDKNLKCGIDHQQNVPEFAVLNPEMCYTLPPFFLSCGIADILSHQFERYFSPTKSAVLSDHLLEGAMRAIIEIGPKLIEDPKNYDLCAELMWSATVSHNGMLDAGRKTDWASHRIEHEISALYDITHGAGMAVIFPAWMKYVKKTDLNRFYRLAKEVFQLDTEWKNQEQIADEAITACEAFFKSLNLKTRLSQSEIPTDKFELMAEKALAGGETLGRFCQLTKADIVRILELAV